MKNLGRQEDVRETRTAMEDGGSNIFLKIPDHKTPWYLISLDYSDGFVHWYDAGSGRRRVVCTGGLEGQGFAPDHCPICAYVLELYQEAKRLEQEGDTAHAKQLRDRANNLRGKSEVHIKAIRGQRVLVKTKTGKQYIPDFETSDDSDAAVGILSLSKAQWTGLTDLFLSGDNPNITSGDDLANRVLWTSKESRKGSTGNKYSAVVWTADEHESDMPDVEIPESILEYDLGGGFEVVEGDVEKVFSLISGQSVETVDADEAVALETDSVDTVSDADLDDLDDDVSDDAFEDDIPDEPPTRPAKNAPSTKSTRRPAERPDSRKSGKARL